MQRVCALSGEQLAVNWFRGGGGGGGGGGECSGQLQLPEVGGEGELGELGDDLEGVSEGEGTKGAREQGSKGEGSRKEGSKIRATLLASDAKLDTCDLQVHSLTHVHTYLLQL